MSNGSTPSRTPAKADAAPLAVTVHSLAQAIAGASAAAGRPILIVSAPDAGIFAGAGWFSAMVEATREAVPAARFLAILDCGGDAGAAMAAIRAGVEAIVFTGRADVVARLAEIAETNGCRLFSERPAAPSFSPL